MNRRWRRGSDRTYQHINIIDVSCGSIYKSGIYEASTSTACSLTPSAPGSQEWRGVFYEQHPCSPNPAPCTNAMVCPPWTTDWRRKSRTADTPASRPATATVSDNDRTRQQPAKDRRDRSRPARHFVRDHSRLNSAFILTIENNLLLSFLLSTMNSPSYLKLIDNFFYFYYELWKNWRPWY